MSGKLRSPTNLPEMSAVEISPTYLLKQNFRFPLQLETGIDGVVRYVGEPHGSRYAKNMKENASFIGHAETYGYGGMITRPENGYGNRTRPIPIPMGSPISPATNMSSYVTPGSAGSMTWFGNSVSPVEQSYVRPGSDTYHTRPGSSRTPRYNPYNVHSPRTNTLSIQTPHQHQYHPQNPQHRRPSVSQQGVIPRRSSQQSLNQQSPDLYGLGQSGSSQQGVSHPSQTGPSQQGSVRRGPSQPGPSHPGPSDTSFNGLDYDVKPVRGPDGQFYYPDYTAYSSMSPQHPYLNSPPLPVDSSNSYQPSQFAGWQPLSQSEPGRTNEHVPRQAAAMTPSLEYSHIPTMPSNASPTDVFQAPPPSVTQGWPHQPPVHGWDPEEYPQGPPQYQPPPSTAQQQQQQPRLPTNAQRHQGRADPQHHQVPASAQDWRDAGNGLASS